MSGRESSIIDQLTISIISFMAAVPLGWLFGLYELRYFSFEYFLSYYMVLLFMGLLFAAIGNVGLIYRASIVLPVAVGVVFRDAEFLVNCAVAFIVYIILLMACRSRHRREVISAITIAIVCICGWKGGMPRGVSAMLIGLAAISASGFATKHLRYAVTVVAVIECIVMLIGVDTKPVMWKPLAKGVDKVWSVVDGAFKDTEYRFGAYNNVSYTGYGEPGGMFQGVDYRYREELKAEVIGKIKMLYLKGASYTDVTKEGISGKVADNVSDNGWFAIYLNALHEAEITKEEARSFSKLLKVNVEYEYIQTEDVLRSANLLMIDEGSDEQELSKEHNYSFNYMALDYANPYLDKLVRGEQVHSANGLWGDDIPGTSLAYDYFYHLKLEAKEAEERDRNDESSDRETANGEGGYAGESDGRRYDDVLISHGTYSEIRDYAYELYNIKLENIMDEEAYEQAFEEYARDGADERYLESPLVTGRIRALTLEVTKGCTSDYERAKSIEAFLRQYNYDTGVDLRGRDNFVEAFLFEEQSGYCVHYATAMVEMLRSIGIPARYTQGYRHITDKGELIYSNEAHAWPEAFIEGIGWIGFEPTVIFVTATDVGWGLSVKGENDTAKEEKIAGYDPSTAVPPSDVETQQKKANQSEEAEGADNEEEAGTGVLDIIKHLGIYLMGMLGASLAAFLLFRLYELIRYSRMSARDKVMADIGTISRKCDRRLKEGETALSVFDYIPYITQRKTDYDMGELFGEYYRIRFRGDEPTKEYTVKLHEVAKWL